MSETDSFIDEVSEEVRRDQLYGVYRKYGWIAIAVVLLIVGAAGFNEWRKAGLRADSQSAGDAILSALEVEDAAGRVDALEALAFDDPRKQALVKLQEAAMLTEDGRIDEAAAVYENVAQSEAAGQVYTDLAKLKLLLIRPDDTSNADVIEELSGLGRPFRLLALEQRALSAVREGNTDAALSDLTAILQDSLTTAGLRERAGQLVVVLGGEIPQQPALVPTSEGG